MPKFPSLTSKKILRILERVGFKVDHVTEATTFSLIPSAERESLSPFTLKIYQKAQSTQFSRLLE
jgi:hypothetical protein